MCVNIQFIDQMLQKGIFTRDFGSRQEQVYLDNAKGKDAPLVNPYSAPYS